MRYLLTAVVVLFGGITAQAQVAGQPYQVPSGYEQYGAGTLINYGGSNYVTSGDGTMLLAADQGGQSQGIIWQPVYQQYQPYYPVYQGGYYGGHGYYRPFWRHRFHHYYGW
jgi:hypothetical protein